MLWTLARARARAYSSRRRSPRRVSRRRAEARGSSPAARAAFPRHGAAATYARRCVRREHRRRKWYRNAVRAHRLCLSRSRRPGTAASRRAATRPTSWLSPTTGGRSSRRTTARSSRRGRWRVMMILRENPETEKVEWKKQKTQRRKKRRTFWILRLSVGVCAGSRTRRARRCATAARTSSARREGRMTTRSREAPGSRSDLIRARGRIAIDRRCSSRSRARNLITTNRDA